jgi:hypothetical protein
MLMQATVAEQSHIYIQGAIVYINMTTRLVILDVDFSIGNGTHANWIVEPLASEPRSPNIRSITRGVLSWHGHGIRCRSPLWILVGKYHHYLYNYNFSVGMRLRLMADPEHYMEGVVDEFLYGDSCRGDGWCSMYLQIDTAVGLNTTHSKWYLEPDTLPPGNGYGNKCFPSPGLLRNDIEPYDMYPARTAALYEAYAAARVAEWNHDRIVDRMIENDSKHWPRYR